MEIFLDGDFWTIVAVVVSAVGVHRAAKADRRKERQEAEQRWEAGERRLAVSIGNVKQELGRRIDRLESRVDENQREVTDSINNAKDELGRRIDRLEDRMDEKHREAASGLAEQKAVIGALSTKIDERSFPRRLEGAESPVAAGRGAEQRAGVRERPAGYSEDTPESEADAPEAGGRRTQDGPSE